MKTAILASVLAGLARASPVSPRGSTTESLALQQKAQNMDEQLQAARVEGDVESAIDARQLGMGSTMNEFTEDGCRDYIFFFARGSTEVGNMGTVVGPGVSAGLKRTLGRDKVATEGIDYGAGLTTNFLPGGAEPEGIQKMQSLINEAAEKCPDAKIFVAGYSQGAALVHRAVEALDEDVMGRVTAAVTFGDTQNVQDDRRIPNYPEDQTLIICNVGDAVCAGTLTILAPHLTYGTRTGEAVRFFSSKA